MIFTQSVNRFLFMMTVPARSLAVSLVSGIQHRFPIGKVRFPCNMTIKQLIRDILNILVRLDLEVALMGELPEACKPGMLTHKRFIKQLVQRDMVRIFLNRSLSLQVLQQIVK